MSRTTFSGPVKSDNGFEGDITGNVSGVVNASILVLPTSTNALLGDKTKAVNTTGKTAGTTVYNTDTKTIYVASAPGVTDKWYDTSDGTTSITPA